MAKINVGELREVLKQNKKDNIKVVDYHGLNLEIKQYIPFLEKVTLASMIYTSSVFTDNGLHIVNGNSIDLAFKVYVTQTYTNLTLPQSKNEENKMETDIITSYDMLVSSGLYDFIYQHIPESEILDVQMALNNLIQYKQDTYEQNLKFEKIVKDGIDGLLIRLDKFIKSMPTAEEMEKMPNIVKDVYKQMQQGIANFTGDEKEYAETVTKVALEDVKRVGNI